MQLFCVSYIAKVVYVEKMVHKLAQDVFKFRATHKMIILYDLSNMMIDIKH